jgi:hypothetical protein
MDWRVLVVDDLQADDVIEVIKGNKVVKEPDSLICIPCTNFSDATKRLKEEKFDLVILDLKNDAANEQDVLAGETVFSELKECRFIPVIFHTGYPHKVTDLTSPYVKVVTRGDDWNVLRSAIKEVLDTKLPKLVKHIEEEQRKFMWESAGKIWTEDLKKDNPADLAYLLARRLANTLSGDVVRTFLEADAPGEVPISEKVHAVELYVYPPLSKSLLFGDIFKKKVGDDTEYFAALTPSCDHAQSKADFVLLAKCKYLDSMPPGESAKASLAAGQPVSGKVTEKLTNFIRDNSKPVDRYKYLPGTSFLPDLLTPAALNPGAEGYERVASLDSPFAEALQAKMARYLGRIGTPDIDPDLALDRFKARIEAR